MDNNISKCLPINGTDYVEFYVGNAKQAAYYYRKAFGFSQIAYSGLETGDREKASYVLAQGRIRLVFFTIRFIYINLIKYFYMITILSKK